MEIRNVLQGFEFDHNATGELTATTDERVDLEQILALKELTGATSVALKPDTRDLKVTFTDPEPGWVDHEDLIREDGDHGPVEHAIHAGEPIEVEVEEFELTTKGEAIAGDILSKQLGRGDVDGENEQKQRNDDTASDNEDPDYLVDESETSEKEEMSCPECGSNNTYKRQRAHPPWKCYKCDHTWGVDDEDDVDGETPDGVEVDVKVHVENFDNTCPQCFGEDITQRLIQDEFVWSCGTCGISFYVAGSEE
jgi:ribosomal protein L37AE/L43A